MSKNTKQQALITKNKKAYFDYEILDKIEAGIILTGAEVKSVKSGHINLKGSHVSTTENTASALQINISAYQASNQKDYNPKRPRGLLLKKKEIANLNSTLNTKGVAIIPLEVYLKSGLIKVLIGIGKGRKSYDKREVLKKRSQEKEIRKQLKRF